MTYFPRLQKVLATEAVPFIDGILIDAVGGAFFVLIEIEKQMRLAFRRPAQLPFL